MRLNGISAKVLSNFTAVAVKVFVGRAWIGRRVCIIGVLLVLPCRFTMERELNWAKRRFSPTYKKFRNALKSKPPNWHKEQRPSDTLPSTHSISSASVTSHCWAPGAFPTETSRSWEPRSRTGEKTYLVCASRTCCENTETPNVPPSSDLYAGETREV